MKTISVVNQVNDVSIILMRKKSLPQEWLLVVELLVADAEISRDYPNKYSLISYQARHSGGDWCVLPYCVWGRPQARKTGWQDCHKHKETRVPLYSQYAAPEDDAVIGVISTPNFTPQTQYLPMAVETESRKTRTARTRCARIKCYRSKL